VTLLGKLTLSSTFSKVIIVLVFIFSLPLLINRVAFQTTNRLLQKQERAVFKNITQNGMDYYLQGDTSYGSYTLLKEEYISLELVGNTSLPDTILTAQRVIEGDTADYRILQRTFQYDNKNYSLEIGKRMDSISQYNAPLQRIALVVLGMLIMLTLITDLFFTRLLLQPLKKIIRSKVQDTVFPFSTVPPPVNTSTSDFANLDRLLTELMHRVNDDFNREREFTSNASHELLTPISIMQSKLENLLLQEKLEAPVEEKLIGMMSSLQRLKKIVQSLLLIARIENDQYDKKETVKPREMVAEIVEDLKLAIEDKNIRCDIDLTEAALLPEVNANLLRQLLFNIIHNAIRYNRTNGSLKIYDRHDDTGDYMLYISDSGPGMPAPDIQMLFQRFKKKSVSSEGYGLGLSIAKAIADYHHCTIDIQSQEGVGSTASLRFPVT
jgi:two-component system, OmpR family, sensor histidine kinase ArlS